MVEVRQAGPEAKERLAKQGRGYSEREPYRQAILALEGDSTVELVPDEGETLRQIRGSLAQAAKEVGKAVKSGETQEGSLLVWLADPSKAGPTPVKRTRRKRNADGVLV